MMHDSTKTGGDPPPPYPTQGFASGYPVPGPYPPPQGPPQQSQTQQGFYPPYPSQGSSYGAFQQQPGGPYQPQAMMQGQVMAGSVLHGGGYDSDVEGGNAGSGPGDGFQSFSDKAVRRAFIRKVYGILMCQLILTGAIIALFMFITPLKVYAIRNRWMYWVAFGVMMVCMLAMVCCESVRRKAPQNVIFLSIFTAAEGFMLGTLAAHFDADAILMAVGICAAVTLALTLFAFQTKYDFTTCGGMLCALVMILMVAGIIMAFLPTNKYAMIGYGSAGALIFSMYIVYDTQLMMGGKHKYSLSPEEYIFASLNLYLDIINLFLYILMIIGAARSD